MEEEELPASRESRPQVHALFKLLHVSCLLMSHWLTRALKLFSVNVGGTTQDMGSCQLLGVINVTIYHRKYEVF